MRRALAAAFLVLALAAPAVADPPIRCTFDSVPELAFGAYDVMSAFAVTSTGQLMFTCKGKDFTVVVGLGRGSSNNPLTRTMRDLSRGSSVLYYNVFSDPGHTQIWGDGTFGSAPVVAIAKNNTRVTLPFYGLIPANQDADPGRYGDSLVVTLNF